MPGETRVPGVCAAGTMFSVLVWVGQCTPSSQGLCLTGRALSSAIYFGASQLPWCVPPAGRLALVCPCPSEGGWREGKQGAERT